MFIVDLDEFLYAPKTKDVRSVLRENEDVSVVGVNWMWFGSSGFVDQPTSIVQSFTKRASSDMSKYSSLLENYKVLKPTKTPESDWQKYIVNTAYRVDNIDIHTVVIEGTSVCLSNCIDPVNPLLLINHYATQSKDFFLKVKSPRGDVNNWVAVGAKNEQWFKVSDINEIEDLRLSEQNKKYGIALEGNPKCDMSSYAKAAAQAGAAATPPSENSAIKATVAVKADVPTAATPGTTAKAAVVTPAADATTHVTSVGSTSIVAIPDVVVTQSPPTSAPVAVMTKAATTEDEKDKPPPPSSSEERHVSDIAVPPVGKTSPGMEEHIYVVKSTT